MSETKKIVLKENRIKELKKNIKKNNEILIALKLEIKLIQKMAVEIRGEKMGDLTSKNEK